MREFTDMTLQEMIDLAYHRMMVAETEQLQQMWLERLKFYCDQKKAAA